ncbi:LOW QUALITY PROTEIN: DNA repair and recombination protein RAD54B-like [Rhagoletis pomonella]|uniref:LOW QUALITY PROTEIN: DNA repair and recombination protein RAD54B-like n=1 Tax=Rhagoletis pomonella TaxID=28610 RepID=UPI001785A37C|nr:LOW QUALITY PROTEIN: DNA repair and recombination protein RAD54B-like [Rhagoletis pomonella]
MRRSCAPSMLRAREDEKRRKIDGLFETERSSGDEVTSTTGNEECWGTRNRGGGKFEKEAAKENFDAFSSKIIFNVVWREITKKKHKTWDGDGLLEVQLDVPKAVLKDSSGRYIGTNTKFKADELEEGYQMVVGGKEIELLEQITDRNLYFALRKKTADSRWNVEEELQSSGVDKKIKLSTLYQAPCALKNSTELRAENIPTTSGIQKRNYTESLESANLKVIFNVVWREITTKKNKTWNGDGIFEVHTGSKRGILKNERGQEMGTLEKVNLAVLEVGTFLEIEDKELEILEIVSQDRHEKENIKQTSHKVHRKCSPSVIVNGLLLPFPPAEYITVLNTMCRPIQPVEISPKVAQHLRPHQREGVVFLYQCVMGFKNPTHRGCILADEMGLGKTLQCLTLARTLLKEGPYGGERVMQRILIVTPSTLTRNWEQEVSKWLKTERMYAFVVGGKQKLDCYAHQQHVPFVIASYENLLANASDFQRLKFDLLICDEGHRLKNQSTKIVASLRELNIPCRIIITGTPVQNDLGEFFALADFVNPGIFGTKQEFHSYYEVPLQQSQCPDASIEVKNIAAQRTQELMQISEQFVLRRLQHVNGQYLPKKYEYICFVRPSELQQFLLQKALQLYAQRKETILKDLSPLQLITVLQKICNHPSLVARTKTPNVLTRHLERCLPDWAEMGPFDSAKLELVQNLLVASAVQNQEKCVLVSNHTKTLNMLQGLCDFLDIKCLRLDGSTNIAQRNSNVEKFNSNADDSLVFLLSAKAGGVGLNLIGASRLILFDHDWNPATDAQATSRIWRDGQQRDVHIYRLVTAGCIEEKIFQRQIAKMSLGDCVTQTIASGSFDKAMKFSADELLDLFSLQEDYSKCQTHESLNCRCNGDGEKLALDTTTSARKMNELMNWKHYKPPFDLDFLEATCLDKAGDNLMYVFTNEIDFS